MPIQWLPQCVCAHLDKTASNFVWKGSSNKGLDMVGLKKMSKPKKLDDLGERIAKKQNTALLGKFFWDMLHPSKHMWSTIILFC